MSPATRPIEAIPRTPIPRSDAAPRHADLLLAGWGNFEPRRCKVYRPESLGGLHNALAPGNTLIPRGAGRAYSDSAVDAQGAVVLMTRLSRMLDFDPFSRLLRCEGGTLLRDIMTAFRPRGLSLPVTPGTLHVTVGGAIAADIHGKNHHRDGSFSNFVREIELLLASGEVIRCSPVENPDIFWATCGGMGLTGIIQSAAIELVRIPSAFVTVSWERTNGLDQTLALMAEGDHRHPYSVAWLDCLASGSALGRCVLMRGRHTQMDELPGDLRANPYHLPPHRPLRVPRFFPGFVTNHFTVGLFNKCYYAWHGDRTGIIGHDEFFYPLDRMQNWNRMYGKAGFVQYQSVIPMEPGGAGHEALVQQLELISASQRASFLAVLKAFGAQGPGLLSFPRPGLTLAVDLPNRPGLREMLAKLDEIVLRHGGRVYLAKDSCLSAESFAAMYPRLGEFRAIKQRIDPQNRFQSAQSRRLGIVEDGPR